MNSYLTSLILCLLVIFYPFEVRPAGPGRVLGTIQRLIHICESMESREFANMRPGKYGSVSTSLSIKRCDIFASDKKESLTPLQELSNGEKFVCLDQPHPIVIDDQT